MPAKGKVSIIWQILFVVFVPIRDLWAFYRIQRLKKYLLYVYLPQIAVAAIIIFFVVNLAFEENGLEKINNFSDDLSENEIMLTIGSMAMGMGFTIFSIYLIATWSEKWNKQFTNLD